MALLTGGRLHGKIPKESGHFINLGKGHEGRRGGGIQQCFSITVLRLQYGFLHSGQQGVGVQD